MLATPRPASGGYIVHTLPPAPFQQSQTLMPMYGGRARHFAQLEDGFATSIALRALLQFDLALMVGAAGCAPAFHIGLHVIRVVAETGVDGSDAGSRHRDGHAWIAMHLIGRQGCNGGTSRIYPGDAAEPMLATTAR